MFGLSLSVASTVVGERELALAIIRYAFGTYGVNGDMAAVAADTLQLPDPHTGRRRRSAAQPITGTRDL